MASSSQHVPPKPTIQPPRATLTVTTTNTTATTTTTTTSTSSVASTTTSTTASGAKIPAATAPSGSAAVAPSFGLHTVIREGEVYKQGLWLKEWKLRWFVLTPSLLTSFTPGSPDKRSELARFAVSSIRVTPFPSKKHPKSYQFTVTQNRKVTNYLIDSADIDAWAGAILFAKSISKYTQPENWRKVILVQAAIRGHLARRKASQMKMAATSSQALLVTHFFKSAWTFSMLSTPHKASSDAILNNLVSMSLQGGCVLLKRWQGRILHALISSYPTHTLAKFRHLPSLYLQCLISVRFEGIQEDAMRIQAMAKQRLVQIEERFIKNITFIQALARQCIVKSGYKQERGVMALQGIASQLLTRQQFNNTRIWISMAQTIGLSQLEKNNMRKILLGSCLVQAHTQKKEAITRLFQSNYNKLNSVSCRLQAYARSRLEQNAWKLERAITSVQALICSRFIESSFKASAHRLLVVQELIGTEQSYVNNLHTVMEEYINPLKVAEPPILSEGELNQVFGNLPKIYDTNSAFLDLLLKEFSDWQHVSRKLVDVFCSPQMTAMKSYLPYILNYDASLAALAQLNSSNEAFVAYCKQCIPKTGGRSLGDFLIQPVQRLPRYLLLLQDYIRTRGANTKYSEQLRGALETVRELTTVFNETKRHLEHMARMAQLTYSLTGDLKKQIAWHTDLQVIKEGPVEAKKGVNYCVLLTQCMLLVKKKHKTDELKIRSLIMCDTITKVTVERGPTKSCLLVTRIKKQKETDKKLTVNQHDLNTWAESLKQAAKLT
ncbi:protein ECT2 [Pelomyxa schiedti]|nr:protein ECT2 [Pelomyxa schiedti]